MMIKTTYSLDVESVRALEEMASRWQVSKSEALRRAIRASAQTLPSEQERATEALDRLQQSLALAPDAADRWASDVRAERLAFGSGASEDTTDA